jgi:hypothetical protein
VKARPAGEQRSPQIISIEFQDFVELRRGYIPAKRGVPLHGFSVDGVCLVERTLSLAAERRTSLAILGHGLAEVHTHVDDR